MALALVWLALAVGTAISLVLSNSTLSTTFSASSDIVAALFLYTFTTTVIPILGVGLLGAAVPAQDGSSLTRISLAGLVVALAGSVGPDIGGLVRRTPRALVILGPKRRSISPRSGRRT